MTRNSRPSEHVGVTIRQSVIPHGMSVKDAAKLLGVGRPALSNLLNGKAALSPEMALRLEQAFGANRQALLDQQARYDGDRRDEKGVAVHTYVPNFLTIKAGQIHGWADSNHEARTLLAVLLRKLVNSTGRDLRRVDFPGYDNAERKGPDGVVEAVAATPWIPEGISYWEFGSNKNTKSKADGDFARRLESVPVAERAQSTFVFVTPRNWPGKMQWAKDKNEIGAWKAVKAFDADDLEHWLEQSITAQIWLVEQLKVPIGGFRTLDQCWTQWAMASDPLMTPELFAPSIKTHIGSLKNWLAQPPNRPFIIAADSKDEALAFIACLFNESEITPRDRDLAAVFDSAQTLRMLAGSSAPFLPIVSTDECERELATLYRRVHCIAVRPRNAVQSRPDIALDLLGYDAFEKALAVMGIDNEQSQQLARESGRSPTILRRRLSKIDAIRFPLWASDLAVARSLIPMTLVGTWQSGANADCEVLSALAGGRSSQEIEEDIARLLQFDDCPVWSVGQYRGVASKSDALFAIAQSITGKDIEDFLTLAEVVLSEPDPALELPDEKRWAASIYGKLRNHSAALRESICETLVILSVYGNQLFRERLGIDIENRVSSLIHRLLAPLTLDKLLSHVRDLPRYAEAAPDAILALLESDLRQPNPVIYGLLKPAESGVFGHCPRTGLLWALECLAWKPENLARVSVILAQCSRIKIDDNWTNKPIASLDAIYRAWMPQTAASLDARVKTLEFIIMRFPDIAWHICIKQLRHFPTFALSSYRPRWRSDACGAGQPVSQNEWSEFTRKALEFALHWPAHNEATLGDLIECLAGMPEAVQSEVWDCVDKWTEAAVDEHARSTLRERIRRFALTRHSHRRKLKPTTTDRAREAYAKLIPRDLAIRHAWLFARAWVEESVDQLHDDNIDFAKRQERIDALRMEAMKEIWGERRFEGILALLPGSEAPAIIGHYAVAVTGDSEASEFLRRCLSNNGASAQKVDGFMHGLLTSLRASTREAVVATIKAEAGVDDVVRLLKCAPFVDHTWRLLDNLDGDIRTRYWMEVLPDWVQHTDAELNEVVNQFLDVNRPRAAFVSARLDWDRVETSRLKRLLRAIATTAAEPGDIGKLSADDISEALQSLGGRAGVSVEEMAQLEFLFVIALEHTKYGIPNLERQLAESPSWFAQAVVLAYKRSNDGQDPPGWQIEDESSRAGAALACHYLLEQVGRIPGTDESGAIDTEELQQWLIEARQLCAQHGRAGMGDQCIGHLLSKGPADENGVWPCRPVREAMETIASEDVTAGFRIGVINGRGAHWREKGGAQERELAAKYRLSAKQVAFDYPYVSSVLEGIASFYDDEAKREDTRDSVRGRIED